MLRRVKKEVWGYLISWWFVKTFWMPIFGLHEWLKNRPRLPVLEASIIGNKVRRLASFSLDRFQMDPNCGDLNNRDEGKVCPEKNISETWLIISSVVWRHYWTLVIMKHYSCWTESIHGWCFYFEWEISRWKVVWESHDEKSTEPIMSIITETIVIVTIDITKMPKRIFD